MQAQRTDEWLNLCEVKYVKLYDKNTISWNKLTNTEYS